MNEETIEKKPMIGAVRYSGSDWMRRQKVEMSPFGEKVADILGQVFRGIYHLESYGITKVDWASDHYLTVKIGRGLDTFDSGDLTELVVMCHDAAIRMEICPCNFQLLKLHFSQRQRHGCGMVRHPTIEEAAKNVHERIGLEIVD